MNALLIATSTPQPAASVCTSRRIRRKLRGASGTNTPSVVRPVGAVCFATFAEQATKGKVRGPDSLSPLQTLGRVINRAFVHIDRELADH